jgi:hypothetical protein
MASMHLNETFHVVLIELGTYAEKKCFNEK